MSSPENGTTLTTLPAAMTGRASPAKAAVGDKPVFAYISSLPQPQRSIAERVDSLAGASRAAASKATSSSRLGAAHRSRPFRR